MMDNELLERTILGLKEQVLEIEESYIKLEDIENKYLPIDALSGYVDKDYFEDARVELQNRDTELYNQMLNMVTRDVLDDYVRKSEYTPSEGTVNEGWIEGIIDGKFDNAIANIINTFEDKLKNVDNEHNRLTDEKIELMRDKIIESIIEELDDYVEKDELDEELQKLGYIGEFKIYRYVKDYVTNELSKFNGLSKDELDGFAKKSDIPVLVSQLVNDKGYLTKHQSLENYAKRSELSSFVTIDKLNSQIESYVKSICSSFITESELPDFGTFITNEKFLAGLGKYVKKSDIESYGFAKKSDLPNFNEVYGELDSYVKTSDFEKHKEDIEAKGYVTPDKLEEYAKRDWVKGKLCLLRDSIPDLTGYVKTSDLFEYVKMSSLSKELGDYAKKSDLNSVSKISESDVKKLIEESISEVKIPQLITDFPDHNNYLTSHQSLAGYVKNYEIKDFITRNDADVRYLKVSDFKLPDNVVYKSDISKFVTSEKFEKLELDAVRKSQLSDYVRVEDFNKKTTMIESDIKSNYVRMSDFEDAIADLTGLTDKSNFFLTTESLNDYVRKDVLSDFAKFEERADKKYLTKSVLDSYGQKVDEKITSQRLWVSENFLTKEDAEKLTNYEITVDAAVFSEYYTKEDTHLRFLTKEDYRGIKRAASLNFEYNDYPDLFFSLLNNHHGIKMIDGFYAVDGKMYIVRNNRIMPVEDRRSPHWVIETEDVDWRNQDIENLNE